MLYAFLYPLRGLLLILTSPRLLVLCLLPVGLSLLLYAGFGWVLWQYSGRWFDALWARSSDTTLETLRTLLYWVFVGILGVIGVLGFVRVVRIVAAPFLDAISLRTEKIYEPGFQDRAPPGSILADIWLEIKKLLLGIFVGILLLLSNLLVPGLGVIVGLLLTWRAIAKDFLGFPLARRGIVEKPAQKAFYRRHFWPVLGFTLGCFFFLMLPVVSIFAIPACTVAATGFYRRLEPNAG